MRQKSIDIPGASHKAPLPMACKVGPMLATSAIGGKDPATGELPEGVDAQVANAFRNLELVLSEAGMDMGDVVKISVLASEESARDAVNKVWLHYYPDEHKRPARHTHITTLRGGMLIQLEVLAFDKV